MAHGQQLILIKISSPPAVQGKLERIEDVTSYSGQQASPALTLLFFLVLSHFYHYFNVFWSQFKFFGHCSVLLRPLHWSRSRHFSRLSLIFQYPFSLPPAARPWRDLGPVWGVTLCGCYKLRESPCAGAQRLWKFSSVVFTSTFLINDSEIILY